MADEEDPTYSQLKELKNENIITDNQGCHDDIDITTYSWMVTKVKNVYTFIQFMEFFKVLLICRVLNGLVQEFAMEVPTLKYTKNRRVEAAIERDIPVEHSELYISLWNDNIQSSKQKKNEASIPVFDSDWTSVSVPQTSEFTRIGRQFHALSANRYTAGIILLASLFAAGYRSRYRKYRVHWLSMSVNNSNWSR